MVIDVLPSPSLSLDKLGISDLEEREKLSRSDPPKDFVMKFLGKFKSVKSVGRLVSLG